MKILFAEDTKEWVEKFKPQLEKLGEVTHVATGIAAIHQLQKHKFDFIVCDHYMPRSCGHEVYSTARRTERSQNKETPYLIFSSAPNTSLYKGFKEDDNAYCIVKDYHVNLTYLAADILGLELPDMLDTL